MVWVYSVTGATYDSGSITVESGATSIVVVVAETTKVTGSDDATDDGIISVVSVIGAAVVGIGTHNSSSVGYPISSLKVAPRLLETGVSVTSSKEL